MFHFICGGSEMNAKHEPLPGCPYFRPQWERICTMTVCGLYVPLAEHVGQYCRTGRWSHCPQYLRGCHSLLEFNWQRGLFQAKGRRRHRRVARRFAVNLFWPADTPAAGEESRTPAAWTLDLSRGGLRIESELPLAAGAAVRFVLGDDSPRPGLSGWARVRWRRLIFPAGTCLVGFAFCEPQAGRALSECCRLP
jgi:hypothetical protein